MRHDPDVDPALARAVLYRALAEGFRPPGPALLEHFGSFAARAALHDAARMLEDEALAGALAELPARPDPEALRADFARLFGHTARGEVPPYETEYGEEEIFRQSHELADLGGFFRAFGVEIPATSHERVDHVSAESEFLCFLCIKEAYAAIRDDTAMLLPVRSARRLFLRDHLGRFGRAFGGRLVRADEGGFYGALGRVLERFLAAECAREGLPIGPDTLTLRPMDLSGIPAACASCPAPGGEPR